MYGSRCTSSCNGSVIVYKSSDFRSCVLCRREKSLLLGESAWLLQLNSMASSSLSLALFLLLFASFAASVDVDASSTGISPAAAQTPPGKPRLGGREKVPDVESNMEVQSLGRFCVDEFNKKQTKGALRFRRVFEAERQVVSGIKYYLKIEAEAGGVKKDYNAVVVVKAWLHSREMLSFEPAAGR